MGLVATLTPGPRGSPIGGYRTRAQWEMHNASWRGGGGHKMGGAPQVGQVAT